MKLWRRVFAYAFYPACMLATALLCLGLHAEGLSGAAAVSVTSLSLGIVIFASQFVQPYTLAWKSSVREYLLDGAHAIVSMGLTTALVQALLYAPSAAIGLRVQAAIGASPWPTAWPLAAQVLFAFVLGDLGPYLFHRLCHESPLWRLHALHHSSERLQLLSAGRNHPLSVFVAYAVQVVLLAVLGAPAEVVMLHSALSGVHGLVQHANLDLRFGWLSYIISTSELHMWHHSRTLRESNSNYGNHVIVWDLLLGTFFRPRTRRPSSDMGLPHGTRFPTTFLGHLASPFIWARIEAPTVAPPAAAVSTARDDRRASDEDARAQELSRFSVDAPAGDPYNPLLAEHAPSGSGIAPVFEN